MTNPKKEVILSKARKIKPTEKLAEILIEEKDWELYTTPKVDGEFKYHKTHENLKDNQIKALYHTGKYGFAAQSYATNRQKKRLREDNELIEAVKELGKQANRERLRLKIAEIPADMK